VNQLSEIDTGYRLLPGSLAVVAAFNMFVTQ